MKKGITFGAFDLCHAGHVLMFKEAKEHCDYLVVGLQKDPSHTSADYRGKKKNSPILSLEERLIILQANRYIDEIIPYETEEDLYEILLKVKPDIRIIGADWKGKKFTGYDLPMEIHYNSRDHKYSTSELRERVYRSEKERLAEEGG